MYAYVPLKYTISLLAFYAFLKRLVVDKKNQ